MAAKLGLSEYVEKNAPKRRGPTGVMHRISDAHRAEAIAGFHSGIPASTIRAWLSELYPELRFTQAACDAWLYKNAPRSAG